MFAGGNGNRRGHNFAPAALISATVPGPDSPDVDADFRRATIRSPSARIAATMLCASEVSALETSARASVVTCSFGHIGCGLSLKKNLIAFLQLLDSKSRH
jgi:hypothetical protein